MAEKTFKLGEVCKGGIITVQTTKTQVKVIGKEWDMSKGTNRGSDQSGAKEFTRLEVNLSDRDADIKVGRFLLDLTTSYHSEQIMDWVKTKVTFKQNSWW